MDAAPIPVETLLEHREWVRAVARAVVRDPNAADDVEQDAWVAALSSPPRHESSLRGWFGAVVRSRARRTGRTDARRGRRETAAARDDADASAADLAEIADTHRRVVQSVVELPEPYRQTILLRYFEGLAVEDVAAKTNAPLNTARARISRGLAQLRERLARELGEDDRPWEMALVPLIGGRNGAAAGTAAAGGTAMATTAGWIAASVLAVAGLGAIVVSKWPASADESKIVALAAAPVLAPAPAPPADDGEKAKPPAPPAPRRAEPAPAPSEDKPAAPAETATQKLDRITCDWQWDNTPLLEILGDISAKTDVDFFIAVEALDHGARDTSPTLQMTNVGANTLVHVLAEIAGLSVTVEDARVVVLPGDGKRDESKPLVAIPRPKAGKKTITVKGVVVDEQGAPVAHASVMSASGETKVVAESGEDGAFSFETGRPFGRIYATVAGRIPSWAFAVKGEYGDVVELRLALRGPAASVEGVVRDAQGREAKGVVVSVTLADPTGGVAPPEGASAPLLPPVTAAADGRYRVDGLVSGEFRISARTGLRPDVTAKGTAKPGESVHLDLSLAPPRLWRGTVRDKDGRPVAGATVQAMLLATVTSASDGSFVVPGIRAGTLQVTIRALDGRTFERPIVVPLTGDLVWDPVIGGGMRIAGRVVDEEGKPVLCNVQLCPVLPWISASRIPAVLTKDGAFAFDDVDAGRYRAVVITQMQMPRVISGEISASTDDVVLRATAATKPTARMKGRVVRADGQPLVMRVFAESVETGQGMLAAVDDAGAFTFDPAPPGRYRVCVRSSNDTSAVDAGVRDVATADVDFGTLTLPATRAVAAKWLRGDGVADDTAVVSVSLVRPEGPRLYLASSMLRDAMKLSPAWRLAPGRYAIRVTGAATQGVERSVVVSATADAEVEIPIRAATPRRIALRFPADAPRAARVRISDDAGAFVHEAILLGTELSVPLAAGRFRVDVDVSETASVGGAFDVPAENAPETFDVVLR